MEEERTCWPTRHCSFRVHIQSRDARELSAQRSLMPERTQRHTVPRSTGLLRCPCRGHRICVGAGKTELVVVVFLWGVTELPNNRCKYRLQDPQSASEIHPILIFQFHSSRRPAACTCYRVRSNLGPVSLFVFHLPQRSATLRNQPVGEENVEPTLTPRAPPAEVTPIARTGPSLNVLVQRKGQ